MTVQELIDRLSQCDPNAAVIIEYQDVTDWVYFHHVGDEDNPIEERDDTIVDNMLPEGSDDPRDIESVYGKGVVINLTEGNCFFGV